MALKEKLHVYLQSSERAYSTRRIRDKVSNVIGKSVQRLLAMTFSSVRTRAVNEILLYCLILLFFNPGLSMLSPNLSLSLMSRIH